MDLSAEGAAQPPHHRPIRSFVRREGRLTDAQRDALQRLAPRYALDTAQGPIDFGQIFGRNDRGLLTETAALPGATATIRAWPDDPEWAEFVAEAIEQDVPVIEDLTGLDWPAGDIEVTSPSLFLRQAARIRNTKSSASTKTCAPEPAAARSWKLIAFHANDMSGGRTSAATSSSAASACDEV